MGYKSLNQCLSDLDNKGDLRRVSGELDPDLEMASIHLDEFARNGKAILFENIKGSKYKAASNLFGSLARSKFMFRDSLDTVKDLIKLKTDPVSALKNPLKAISTALNSTLPGTDETFFGLRVNLTGSPIIFDKREYKKNMVTQMIQPVKRKYDVLLERSTGTFQNRAKGG